MLCQLAVKKFRFTIYLFLLASSTLVPVADTVVNRLQKMDRDGDGKLSREEAPQSIRKFKFDLADRNKDGFLDTRELQRLLAVSYTHLPLPTNREV